MSDSDPIRYEIRCRSRIARVLRGAAAAVQDGRFAVTTKAISIIREMILEMQNSTPEPELSPPSTDAVPPLPPSPP